VGELFYDACAQLAARRSRGPNACTPAQLSRSELAVAVARAAARRESELSQMIDSTESASVSADIVDGAESRGVVRAGVERLARALYDLREWSTPATQATAVECGLAWADSVEPWSLGCRAVLGVGSRGVPPSFRI
jgi:hypothetical protein